MKNYLPLLALLFTAASVYPQEKKPSPGDFTFGLGFGLNSTPGTSIKFGGMLKDNFELGAGIYFTASGNNDKSTNPTTTTGTNGPLQVTRETTTKRFTYTLGLHPYLLYHFPIKSNFDVHAGIWIGGSITQTPVNENTSRSYADNFLSYSKSVNHSLLIYGLYGGPLAGAQYFFHKNIAAGLQGSIGFKTSFEDGKSKTTSTTTDSGSLNKKQGTITTSQEGTVHDTDGSFSLTGGVSITLTFFFARKVHHNSLPNID